MLRRRAFTVPEMLAVVAIIVIIITILIPSIARAREVGRRAVCGSNLRQLNVAARAYRTDHADFPASWHTINVAYYPSIFADDPWVQYVASREVFGCPSGRKVSNDLPNWDGNWPGPYTIGGYMYVGNLPEVNPSGWNQWGLDQVTNAAQVCRKRDGGADKLLVTEGIQGWAGGPSSGAYGIYFSHGKDLSSYNPVDPVYEGIHVSTDPSKLAGIAGIHNGFGDGHVQWKQATAEFNDAAMFWDVSWKYSHWYWAKWYW